MALETQYDAAAQEDQRGNAPTCSVDMRVRGGVSEGVAAGVVEHDASPGW